MLPRLACCGCFMLLFGPMSHHPILSYHHGVHSTVAAAWYRGSAVMRQPHVQGCPARVAVTLLCSTMRGTCWDMVVRAGVARAPQLWHCTRMPQLQLEGLSGSAAAVC
jgi:hypothetical protein